MNMIADYLRIVVTSLTKRKLRSWLTLIGIFIGITSVVALIGLGEGLRNAITGQFSMLSADVITIQASGVQFGPPGSGVVTPLKRALEQKLEQIPSVEYAIGRLILTGRVEFNDKLIVTGAMTSAEGEKRQKMVQVANIEIESGRFLKDSDKNKAVIGINFYKNDEVFGKPIVTGDTIKFNGIDFDVIGILKEKGSFIIDNIIVINEGVVREMADDKETDSMIIVTIKEGADIEKVKDEIIKLLRKERDVKEGEEDFIVETSKQLLEQLNSAIFGVQLFVYIIAAVSILVGGIGIMNTMYTSVLERTRDIGVMKSIGAKNNAIFTIFFLESGMLGMVGGVIGAIGGTLFAYGIAFIGKAALHSDLIQAHISPFLILGAISFSFLVGTVAGISPAIRASRLKPVDALRFTK